MLTAQHMLPLSTEVVLIMVKVPYFSPTATMKHKNLTAILVMFGEHILPHHPNVAVGKMTLIISKLVHEISRQFLIQSTAVHILELIKPRG